METNEQHQEKMFYQDSTVTVTQSRYIAGSKTYAMRNISSVSLFKIDKSRTGAILLLIVGILLLFFEGIRVVGVILAILGGIWLFSIKDEYSVRISTNAGEANSLVSKDQAYIQKVVNALNDAIIHRG
ncbi:MAG: QacE [Aequorivita sp.]|nr:QacE [Aequorivita sp.]MBP40505.1 QacE [Aequorivita sp.]|tara:strand:+ start:7775 stop:8158 length:384 start_codon:yes stop_codon:yes gene_type:complete